MYIILSSTVCFFQVLTCLEKEAMSTFPTCSPPDQYSHLDYWYFFFFNKKAKKEHRGPSI